MDTCSVTTHFKISVCSKAFVECITCFSELAEASSSSFQLVPLTLEASPNIKRLNKTCV